MGVPILFIGLGTLLGFALVLSIRLALWALLVLAIVVSGLIMYFHPQLATVRWGVVAISGLLLLRVGFDIASGRSHGRGRIPAPLALMLAFGFSVLLTTGLNMYPTELVIASKNMFQFWSVPFALYFGLRKTDTATGLLKATFYVAALQPLIALVQYHYAGSAMFSGDRISGSFGGMIGMPGGSGPLGMFMTASIGGLLALSQKGRLAWRYSIPLMAWFMVPILLANVRATLVLIPVVFLVVYLPELRRRPMVFVGVGVVLTMLMAVVFVYYYRTAADYNSTGQGATSMSQFVGQALDYNISSAHGLTRISAITYWYRENSPGRNFTGFLFGHGLGSVKRAGLIYGHVYNNPKYLQLRLGLAALPRLLWDVGIIGTLLYMTALLMTYRMAGRLRRSSVLTDMESAMVGTAQGAAAVLVFSLPYDLAIISNQAFSAYSMFIVGYVVLATRLVRERARESVREPLTVPLVASAMAAADAGAPAGVLRPATPRSTILVTRRQPAGIDD